MASESPVTFMEQRTAEPFTQVFQEAGSFSKCPMPRLLPALFSAGLLWLCYFPLAWSWLAWVALVPLLCLVRAEGRARNIYWSAWAAGLAFFWPALQWMRVADYRMYYTWAMLATYCALYFPAAIYLLRKLDRGTRLPLVITVPVVWTALEFLRSFLLTGFAWYYLGHTQHAFLPIIQIADLTGAYGVTFLVAAANAWIFQLLFAQSWFRDFFRLGSDKKAPDESFFAGNRKPKAEHASSWLAFQGLVVFLALVATLFYGFWRLDQEDFRPGPRVGLLQGNIDQRIRLAADQKNTSARLDINKHYIDLCRVALQQQPRPDLLVWPETSFPSRWIDISPKLPPEKIPEEWLKEGAEIQGLIALMAESLKTNHLLGMNADILNEHGQHIQYNSALLVQHKGDMSQRYDKIHRVPFGEYVPFKDWLPFMNAFAPYDNDYSIREGEHLTRFKLGQHHFGVLICFEDTDPAMARQYGKKDADGPPADFLLNISNDGWFDGTSEHAEHLAICRFRAIECRRAVARSVNMGISAVIDSNGKVLEPRLVGAFEGQSGKYKSWEVVELDGQVPELPTGRWSEFKKVAGVVGATIPIDSRTSLYAYLGDWLPWTCWAVIGGGIVLSIRRRRQLLANVG